MEDSQAQSNIRSSLVAAFGNADLYAILGVESAASADEIKKAYRKLALKHHPDRGGTKEKFQALSIVYSILSDEEKRKVYDETGSVEDSEESSNGDINEENFEFWNNYFRSIFPKVTIAKIDEFKKSYVGSEEEKQDVIDAYNRYDGDLSCIMECVMFAEEGEEGRICQIIDQAIEDKLIESITSKYKKTRVDIDSSSSSSNKKIKGKKRAKKDDACDEGEGDADSYAQLAAAIRNKKNHSQSSSMFQNIMEKYGGDVGGEEEGEEDDIDDEEFERIRNNLSTVPAGGKKNKKNSNNTSSKSNKSNDENSSTTKAKKTKR